MRSPSWSPPDVLSRTPSPHRSPRHRHRSRSMRWFEAPARTAAPKGHHLHLLRSTAFNPRITYTRIRPPALVAHLFSRTRSPPAAPCSPPAAWRSRLTPRSPSCAWSTPDPHGLRNQVVGGGHGRDRALLLQDLANDLLLELIGVFGSGHELILSCHGKKLFPSPEDSAHSKHVCQGYVLAG